MKKFFLVPAVLFLFGACVAENQIFDFEETAVYNVKGGGLDLYFKFPVAGNLKMIDEKMGDGEFVYENCPVKLGFSPSFSLEEQAVYDDQMEKKDDSVAYRSYFNQGLFSAYSATNTDFNYGFWIYDQEKDISNCVDLVDFMANSLTDSKDYVNEEFSFSAPFLDDFSVEYMTGDQGIIMEKDFHLAESDRDMKYPDRYPENYSVEIGVLAFYNDGLWADLADYVNSQYVGFTVSAAIFNGNSGIYVTEQSFGEAIQHFFLISKNQKIFYEAYLKVPGVYFARHEQFFADEVLGEMKIY